jgi:sec-independent protein translocase protein TatC
MTHDDEEQGARTHNPTGTPDESAAQPAASESYASDTPTIIENPPQAVVKSSPPSPPPPPRDSEADEEDADEGGMLRMSFLEHLEELRSRILKALGGIGVAFLVCVFYAERLWVIVSEPATQALLSLGFKEPKLAQLTPMEGFSVIWVKLPMLASIFLASPWVLYQVWAFIAPGLYKRERRWATPFVICSAGLFITGGLFAYFVAFRFGLTFLLGIGRDINIIPLVSISEYFDLFVNVMLGIGLVFELPVIIFFLTLLRIASPAFLLRHSRYAILGIVILAAIITPTPDVFNLMLFAVPMVALFFIGVLASYLLVLNRENRRFPWLKFLLAVGLPLGIIAGGLALAILKFGLKLVPHWPFLVR